MNRTALYEIRRILYSFKRKFAGSVVIHRRSSSQVDLETGELTVTTASWPVDKAIILPNSIHREFSYDLAFIAAAKNFTYGGFYDTGTRRIIIDPLDMPIGWRPSKDDYVIFDRVRYEIKEIETFEFNAGWLFTLKALTEQTPAAIIPVHWRSTLHLNDEVGNA